MMLMLLAGLAGLYVAAWLTHRLRPFVGRRLPSCRRALLVIAHPDDEAMFFAPTLLGLARDNSEVYVLCLSSGNREGLGALRKWELRRSCGELAIPESHIFVVDHTRLPDDPSVSWNRAVVADLVLRYVEQLDTDTVISFDGGGVSGHRNHTSLHRALQTLYSSGKLPSETQVFVLETANLLRKYSGVADVLCAPWLSSYSYVSPWVDVRRARTAMRCHRSQMLWFRWLYIIFSRYMVVNSLRRISMESWRYKYSTSSAS